MIYFLLAFEFFKIGLFSFGGGYATLPFLYQIAITHWWYTPQDLTKMTAVASITPGPVGINVATYAGVKTAGILGALIATVAEIIPSLIVVIIISKLLKKYSENFYVKSCIETFKPLSCALLVSVAYKLFIPAAGDTKGLFILGLMLLISLKAKKVPLIYLVFGGLAGLLLTVFC